MSQPEPNLTVVIPVHNAAPHLGACVESLLAQSYTDFELILVENGSSDDSRERCARYAAEHPGRIRTLTLDEASVSAARNAGIDNARGRFITFMDADDWAEKEFLAEFFRDPAPGPGTIVMQGILLDFSEAEPPGPNEAFFSYDDGALAIGDDPSAAVGQRFLQDGCSVCKLYHTETLRRLGIRFIEHLCSREDHLFFFTCISRMQSVVWRSGLYMHYMRRGRNTLSTRPMPACELVEAAERLDRFIPQLAERFGITDKAYLFALRQNLVRDTLLRAANNIRFGDRRSVLGAIAARPELFGAETYTPRWHPLLKRPLLDRILKGREGSVARSSISESRCAGRRCACADVLTPESWTANNLFSTFSTPAASATNGMNTPRPRPSKSPASGGATTVRNTARTSSSATTRATATTSCVSIRSGRWPSATSKPACARAN